MLTAKTEYMDKITGLTLGADDYIAEAVQPTGAGCESQGTAPPVYAVQ